MYRNKYTLFKRLLYRLQEAVPVTRRVKGAFLPFRLASFEKRLEKRRKEVEESRRVTGHAPLFKHIEIETFNRCNGECDFCPVNRHIDPRHAVKMSDELFDSIIGQLRELDYDGDICLFSNNESLLDKRIEDFSAKAKQSVPKANIVFSTNGTLLTPERYRALIDNTDLFYVNNYCDDFQLTPLSKEIMALAQSRDEWWRKTHIVIRYRREIMSSRGGQAPNKSDLPPPALKTGCTYPAEQMIVRPDGKLSLCCNDALGKYTLGDLSVQSLTEAWWGEKYENLRSKLLSSRSGFELCHNCDTLGD